MRSITQRKTAMLVLIGLLCLLLLGQIIASFLPSPARGAANVTLPSGLTVTAAGPTSPRDSTLYQLIGARLVFSATRRPTIVSAAAVIAPTISLTLVGILHAPDGSFAIARMQANPNLILLERGTNIQGWVVADIERDRVTLQTGQTKQILTLQKASND